MIFHCFLPAVIVEILAPRIIETAILICLKDHIIQSAVSSGKHTLQLRYIRIMTVILDTLCIKLIFDLVQQKETLFLRLLLCIHRCPLERCKRLWYKDRRTRYNVYFAVSLILRQRIIFSGKHI